MTPSPADFAGRKPTVQKIPEHVITSAPRETYTPEWESQTLNETAKYRNSLTGDMFYDTKKCYICETGNLPKVKLSQYAPPLCSLECIYTYISYVTIFNPTGTCQQCKAENVTVLFENKYCRLECVKAVKVKQFKETGVKSYPTEQDKVVSLPTCELTVARIVTHLAPHKSFYHQHKLLKKIISAEQRKLLRTDYLAKSLPTEYDTITLNSLNSTTGLIPAAQKINLLINPPQTIINTLTSPTKTQLTPENKTLTSKPATTASDNEKHLQNAYQPKTFNTEKQFKERVTVENTRQVREREKKRNNEDFLCPNPYKKVYRTQNEAYDFIKEHHAGDKDLRPYRCRCGALHIGHHNNLVPKNKRKPKPPQTKKPQPKPEN